MSRMSRSVYENQSIQRRESYQAPRPTHLPMQSRQTDAIPTVSEIEVTLKKIAIHLLSGRWENAARVIEAARRDVAEARRDAISDRQRRVEMLRLMAFVDGLMSDSVPAESAAAQRRPEK